MYKVDMFANTGFNSVDIPSGPALVYQIAKDDFSKPAGDIDAVKWYQFDDINIVQDEWEANIILPKEAILMRNDSTGINVDFDNKEARHIDYVIIVDSDHYNSGDWYYYTSCYTVKNYQDVGNCIKFNLLLDPYTTMGGFEYDYGNHVISGSANRLTVPLAPYVDKNGNSESTPGYEHYKNIYSCREDNHFFSLDEPYQNRHPEVYTRGTYVPPTPGPDASDEIVHGKCVGVFYNNDNTSENKWKLAGYGPGYSKRIVPDPTPSRDKTLGIGICVNRDIYYVAGEPPFINVFPLNTLIGMINEQLATYYVTNNISTNAQTQINTEVINTLIPYMSEGLTRYQSYVQSVENNIHVSLRVNLIVSNRKNTNEHGWHLSVGVVNGSTTPSTTIYHQELYKASYSSPWTDITYEANKGKKKNGKVRNSKSK